MAGDTWTGGPGAAWSDGAGEDPSTDGFWASYSDLMAGILMIFVLSSVLAVNAAIESSRVFDGFRDAMSALCRELEPAVDQNERVTMDCDTTRSIEVTTGFPGFISACDPRPYKGKPSLGCVIEDCCTNI